MCWQYCKIQKLKKKQCEAEHFGQTKHDMHNAKILKVKIYKKDTLK